MEIFIENTTFTLCFGTIVPENIDTRILILAFLNNFLVFMSLLFLVNKSNNYLDNEEANHRGISDFNCLIRLF